MFNFSRYLDAKSALANWMLLMGNCQRKESEGEKIDGFTLWLWLVCWPGGVSRSVWADCHSGTQARADSAQREREESPPLGWCQVCGAATLPLQHTHHQARPYNTVIVLKLSVCVMDIFGMKGCKQTVCVYQVTNEQTREVVWENPWNDCGLGNSPDGEISDLTPGWPTLRANPILQTPTKRERESRSKSPFKTRFNRSFRGETTWKTIDLMLRSFILHSWRYSVFTFLNVIISNQSLGGGGCHFQSKSGVYLPIVVCRLER